MITSCRIVIVSLHTEKRYSLCLSMQKYPLLISSVYVIHLHIKGFKNTDIHHGNITESTISLRRVRDRRDFFS